MTCSQVGQVGHGAGASAGVGTGGGLTPLSCPDHVPAAADSAQDLAAELVHYGFVHEVCGLP